jgi:LDH2 family malate/lactate/ureidoglycolate dehydrogenase
MNVPPVEHIRVPHADLHAFVSSAAQRVGLPVDRSELLAELLTTNDLRGVFSHGTRQIATYAVLMRDGALNNQPDVRVVRETPTSLVVDGDGGLGYFPAHEGTSRAVDGGARTRHGGHAIAQSRPLRRGGHLRADGLAA